MGSLWRRKKNAPWLIEIELHGKCIAEAGRLIMSAGLLATYLNLTSWQPSAAGFGVAVKT